MDLMQFTFILSPAFMCKNLLTPPLKPNPNIVFLGKGKNGIVYKINKDTTIKIMKNINLDCSRDNKYAKFCTSFYNEVMIGMLLNNLVIQKVCYNFPRLKSAMVLNEIGVIIRDYSEHILSDFSRNGDILLRQNLTMIEIVDILFPKYL